MEIFSSFLVRLYIWWQYRNGRDSQQWKPIYSSIYRKLVENWKLCSDTIFKLVKVYDYYYQHFSITFNEIPEHMAKTEILQYFTYIYALLSAIYLRKTFSMFAFRALLWHYYRKKQTKCLQKLYTISIQDFFLGIFICFIQSFFSILTICI